MLSKSASLLTFQKSKFFFIYLLLISISVQPITGENCKNDNCNDNSSKYLTIGGAVVGSVAAIAAAPYIVGAVGFTAVGIKAGSLAAGWMSTLGTGSTIIATCQSIGSTGTVLGSVLGTGLTAGTGAVVGGSLAAARNWLMGREEKKKEGFIDSCKSKVSGFISKFY